MDALRFRDLAHEEETVDVAAGRNAGGAQLSAPANALRASTTAKSTAGLLSFQVFDCSMIVPLRSFCRLTSVFIMGLENEKLTVTPEETAEPSGQGPGPELSTRFG